jgi:hypothetical protein
VSAHSRTLPAPPGRPAAPSLGTISLPDAAQLEALIVADDSCYPAFRAGDVVLHRRLQPQFPLSPLLHGVECVVEISGGERLLRQVTIQPDGRATLIGYAIAPLFNVTVVAAAPVELVMRNARPAPLM